MVRNRIRQILTAINLETLNEISALDLLDFDVGRHARQSADKQKKSDQPFICKKCEKPVIVPMHWRTREYYFKHLGNQADCPWTSESSITVDAASARIFGGQQEGPLHKRIKLELGALLNQLPGVGKCWIDERYKNGAGEWKKPDLRFSIDGRNFVIEIQLATTQRPIITERNQFYIKENIPLIWVTWQPEPLELRNYPASVVDIATDHNDNLFSVDGETFDESRKSGSLKFRVHWWEGPNCRDKLVSFSELIFRDGMLPYAIEKPAEWHDQFKADWIAAHSGKHIPHRALSELWSRLVAATALRKPISPHQVDWTIVALVNALLSLERSTVVGSDQKNLTEILHTFFTTVERKPMARIVEHAIRQSGNGNLLHRDKTKKLLAEAKTTDQVSRQSAAAAVAKSLFPEWSAVKAPS